MRITGGQAKGRRLASPKGLNIRPSSDHVREAIFDMVGQALPGLIVLDLFAGTGSLGLEALSRGASHALFIDNSRQSINLINKNLSLCGYQVCGTVFRRDLKKGIPRGHPLLKYVFDLVFLDPPYGKNLLSPLLEALSTRNVLSSESKVIAECSKTEKLPGSFGNLEMMVSRLYGDTRVSIYTNEVGQ